MKDVKNIKSSDCKILVIGNGFDIAHGLPTRYNDFIKFIVELKKLGFKHSELSDDVLEKFKTNCENNLLIDYFIHLHNINRSKENWVDFEGEISEIVKFYDLKNYPISDNFKSLGGAGKRNEFKNTDTFLLCLNNLIDCFDMYLDNVVRKQKIEVISPDIKDLEINKILNFNYTDTYSKLYDLEYEEVTKLYPVVCTPDQTYQIDENSETKEIEIDFIHGKTSKLNGGTNNIVMGIDEYLTDGNENTNIKYIRFKKYFQRIQKKTGCKYKEWLNELQKHSENEVYFFGHSLAVSDKDILSELILCHKIKKCTIFYYDQKDYEEKVINLAQIIGKDTLIENTYSGKIEFKKQRDMILNTL